MNGKVLFLKNQVAPKLLNFAHSSWAKKLAFVYSILKNTCNISVYEEQQWTLLQVFYFQWYLIQVCLCKIAALVTIVSIPFLSFEPGFHCFQLQMVSAD